MLHNLIIKDLKKNEDERGWLAEFWRNDEVSFLPVMSYVSFTRFGLTRGPHEHASQSDYFVFVGPGNFKLYLWDRREDSPTKGKDIEIVVGESRPCFVIVPPGIVHGYKCVSQEGALVINLPNKLYRGKHKAGEIDEIRWEQDPNSLYKIT